VLSLAVYNTVHFLVVFVLVTALAASLARAAMAPAADAPASDPWGKRLGIAHVWPSSSSCWAASGCSRASGWA
jgi:hypothetical protein